MKNTTRRSYRLALHSLFSLALLASPLAFTQQEVILHDFNQIGKDGVFPAAGLIVDAAGNLYGTAPKGGPEDSGVVFELSPKTGGHWQEKILHSFDANANDGIAPRGGVIFDSAGNLYGSTTQGGKFGYGVVYELSPKTSGAWTEKILQTFNESGSDPAVAYGNLVLDSSGNLYGTTYAGGAHEEGTVFELSPTTKGPWKLKILHTFDKNGVDGYEPFAGLIFDSAGNLYGTTAAGGVYGQGTAFELSPTESGPWTETLIHQFVGNTIDGGSPEQNLTWDASGNLYGVTETGGTYNGGTVFELSPAGGGTWNETILHDFDPSTKDGYLPEGSVTLDSSGNVYGTTGDGGADSLGTVYELTNSNGTWTENILYSFQSTTDAYTPLAGVIIINGNLYGTTTSGGTFDYGTVFEIIP